MSLRRNKSISQYYVLQILIHLLLNYHYQLCSLIELCELRRPRTSSLSISEGDFKTEQIELSSQLEKVSEIQPADEASVILQVVPENPQSGEVQGGRQSRQSSEDDWGMRESEWDEFTKFSKNIPGIRSFDPKYPKLIREIAYTIISPQDLWSRRLKRMCERFYTQGIQTDPNEQVSLLKALHRFTELYKMPFEAVQIVLGALARMELFVNEGYEKNWLVEHQKTESKYVELMLEFIDSLDSSGEYAEFRRIQANLGDYGVKLKKLSFQQYEKYLFKFWISRESQKIDVMQEIVELQLILIKRINPSNSKKRLQSNIAETLRNDPSLGYLTERFIDNLNSLQQKK
ncbi:uncharacterized protein MELLADRAFT_68721 [Melampsora larici-populina 98AG31]|uniref:Uncharacterized protein n=1 Tax=Melampsora larici-populina (strain 98AG31 / pathotype 3-4-7) TaxID=747676 RepID=F4S7Y4_MELLP|nr:uncharacterized protein MELLADRAFT_68721 [Melampsora larici-populina 98AG31]EGF99247.1 hypothetical protein MELLADRAFT_68721 [Melampsora larici-populina 98AG31]